MVSPLGQFSRWRHKVEQQTGCKVTRVVLTKKQWKRYVKGMKKTWMGDPTPPPGYNLVIGYTTIEVQE